METSSPTYRIETRSGTVIGIDLPRSAPAIQLIDGTLSKGHKPPKELLPGESSVVSYPLVEGSLVCRVVRVDGIDSADIEPSPVEFVEPDALPKKEKRNTFSESMQAAHEERSRSKAAMQVKEAIEGTKARRGRNRKS